jgi:hypothetical protein
MKNVARLVGIDRWPCQAFLLFQHLERISRTASSLAALVALAIASQGCFNTSPQTTELAYGGPAEYAANGYSNDPFAAYDPFLYSYYCPLPYYYSYYRGDGDRDCDDGFCGHRGGRKPPHLPLIAGSLPARVPLRERAEVTQRTGEGAQSAAPAPWISPRNLSADSYRGASVPSGGFGGGGYHSDGLGGGGFHGSSHR